MALSPRGRRWLRLLAVFALLAAVGAWWVDRQLEPQRLTATVLAKAGAALKLDLRYAGEPDYALRPEPRLLIPNLEVRDPRDGKLILRAQRAEVSLPWATLTGGEPVITRVELDVPTLDLPALQRWLASRPAAPFQLPTLTRGLAVTDGTITDTAFTLSNFSLDLPHLKTGDAATATTAGMLSVGETHVDFNAKVTAATPGLASAFTVDGSGMLKQSPKPLPFKLALKGDYRSDDKDSIAITAPGFVFSGMSPLPELKGKTAFALGETMRFTFDGLLEHWPADWPALPQPFAQDTSALPIVVAYAGKADLSDPLSLNLHRGDTTLDAKVRVPEMQAWIDAPGVSPLPPLTATLATPLVEFDGIRLEGVQIEMRDDAPKAAEPTGKTSASK